MAQRTVAKIKLVNAVFGTATRKIARGRRDVGGKKSSLHAIRNIWIATEGGRVGGSPAAGDVGFWWKSGETS